MFFFKVFLPLAACIQYLFKAVNIINARVDGDAERDDPTWYPVIYGYQGDDIYSEDNWKKANPGLGVTIQIEDMRVLAKQAKALPLLRPRSKTLPVRPNAPPSKSPNMSMPWGL